MSHNGFNARCGELGWQAGCAENVAWNMQPSVAASATHVVNKQWMESPEHYKNLMGDYGKVGYGWAICGDGATIFWTAIFGK
jgi:uncharacterized protein YkwD